MTTSHGCSVPIFKVEPGPPNGRAAVPVKVEGQEFWIRRHELGAKETDFSYRALAIVKDLQALNTDADQIPASPTIIVTPATSVSR